MKPFKCSRDTPITQELLNLFMSKHNQTEELPRYKMLRDYYEGFSDILKPNEKDKTDNNKPNNKIPVNFAGYITDCFNGYFIGKPIKVLCPDEKTQDILKKWGSKADEDDNNAEISKMCCIFGRGYKLLYQDEEGNTCATFLDPTECFVVYDTSPQQEPYFAVYYTKDPLTNIQTGYLYTKDTIYTFTQTENNQLKEYDKHLFGDVPIVEFVQNEERRGVFEPVIDVIAAYDKAYSEKANDVEYFADAYMKVIGAELDEKALKKLRDTRIINLFHNSSDDSEYLNENSKTENTDVSFMEKPNADETQENFLDRSERLIFTLSKVINLTDEKFLNASGESIKQRMQPMEYLAGTKQLKFISSLKRVYKMLFKMFTTAHILPESQANADDEIHFLFTRDVVQNRKEVSEIAKNLLGIASSKTILSLFDFVPDITVEQEQIKKEQEEKNAVDDNYSDLIDRVENEQAKLLDT